MLGVIGGFLFAIGAIVAIVFGFIGLSRISRSGGARTGRGLAIAGIVLGFAWIAVIGVIVALSASGAFDDSNAKRFGGEKKAVAQTVDDFESAADAGDGARLCRLFTPRYAAIIALGAAKPCADAILAGSGGHHQAHLDVKSITIAGTRATSKLEEGGDPEVWTFVRTDRWRIDNIARDSG